MSAVDGGPVERVAVGTYRLVVDDRAEIHNFRVTGTDLNVATGVAEVGVTTWTVTLTNGVYLFRCDPHPDMRGWLVVGTAETPGVATSQLAPGGAPARPSVLAAALSGSSGVSKKTAAQDAACRTCKEGPRRRVPFRRRGR